MTDVSIGMMSHCNSLAMYRQSHHQQSGSIEEEQHEMTEQQQARHFAIQQQAAAAAAAAAAGTDSSPPQPYWYGYPHGHLTHVPHHHHHHNSGPQQYLDYSSDVRAWSHHPHYSHHLQYQHQHAYQQHQHHQQQSQLNSGEWSGDDSSPHIHQQHPPIGTGEPSPPITVSGSEISSPATPSTSPVNNNNNSNSPNNKNSANLSPVKPPQIRSPFEWMNKPSYQSQPNPGKTRTKDKYRVVYTDHQRLELEKEFHFNRYITIRRKSELAAHLELSERQVKIWFQNRRAKERKLTKKLEYGMKHEDVKPFDMGSSGGMPNLSALGAMGSMLGSLLHHQQEHQLQHQHQDNDSPPLSVGPPSHGLGSALPGHPPSSLLPHHNNHHAHSDAVVGL